MAITDGLTGLYNHKYMFDKLKTYIQLAKRYKNGLAIIMLDIDNFKNINDTYGHIVGDKIIKQIARELDKNTRETDLVGRYGGEEFLVVLPNLRLQEAVVTANKLCKIIEESKLDEIEFTASFGVYEYTDENSEKLVNLADTYLYKAKENGRNRVEYKKNYNKIISENAN